MSWRHPLELPLGLADEPLFVLDGRTVGFPEGLRTAEFTHTIHRFPGKFVPQVARELIGLLDVSPGAGTICDPFCGSGTTLVEAAAIGLRSVGADFDPLGVLISRVKTTPLSSSELDTLSNYWRTPITGRETPAHAPRVRNLDHWFTMSAIAQLSEIKERALALPERLRDFSLVVFSSIIRRVSNADDQTQKTYVSGTLPKTPPAPSELFPVLLSRAISGMAAYSAACIAQPTVVRADARHWLGGGVVDGVATSPPYLDSIDYVYNQMLEYFWLHAELGLAGETEIRAMRSQPIGFSRGSVERMLEEIGSSSPELADRLLPEVRSIETTSRKEAEHVTGYFRDYLEHLRVCRAAMSPRARYAMAVGESVVRGRLIQTPDLLSILFKDSGFSLLGRCSYQIKRHYMKFPRRSNSGTIKLDHILCFEAE
jgi:hypothetical protein